MPPRSNPTARQARFGAEMRKMREAAGRTSSEAAALLGLDQTKISHVEAGRVGLTEERVRRLTAFYACDDAALVHALAGMATERVRGWWEQYRGVLPPVFLDLAELEYHATYLHTVEVTQIPGLLQTEDHARAIFAYAIPELSPDDLEPRVALRLQRQSVLDRQPQIVLDALIHESALRIRVSDRKIARGQLLALLDASERANVTLRVIPFDADGFGGAGYSMVYVGGPVAKLDTVQLDAAHSSVILDLESQLRRHRALFNKISRSALNSSESRELIHHAVAEL
jgi:hypothetical protein